MGKDAVIVTVFPDDNKKYLSTDLMKEQPQKAGFLSPDVELKGFSALKRSCNACCEPESCPEKAAGEKPQCRPCRSGDSRA